VSRASLDPSAGFGVPALAGGAFDDEAGLQGFNTCCDSDTLPAEAGTPNPGGPGVPLLRCAAV